MFILSQPYLVNYKLTKNSTVYTLDNNNLFSNIMGFGSIGTHYREFVIDSNQMIHFLTLKYLSGKFYFYHYQFSENNLTPTVTSEELSHCIDPNSPPSSEARIDKNNKIYFVYACLAANSSVKYYLATNKSGSWVHVPIGIDKTFQSSNSFDLKSQLAITEDGSKILVGLLGDYIYHSTNGGQSFELLSHIVSASDRNIFQDVTDVGVMRQLEVGIDQDDFYHIILVRNPTNAFTTTVGIYYTNNIETGSINSWINSTELSLTLTNYPFDLYNVDMFISDMPTNFSRAAP